MTNEQETVHVRWYAINDYEADIPVSDWEYMRKHAVDLADDLSHYETDDNYYGTERTPMYATYPDGKEVHLDSE